MPRVLVIGGDYLVERMFHSAGWELITVSDVVPPDLVCFTGGEDVDPRLYGEEIHPTTIYSRLRDDREIILFSHYRTVPKVGICRGGQFLNVMNGGKLWQDVDNHAIRGTHGLRRLDVDNHHSRTYQVTSTHHQMMRPSHDGIVIARADWVDEVRTVGEEAEISGIEVVFYPETNSLCFQPHPEYYKDETRELFFELINKFLMRGE